MNSSNIQQDAVISTNSLADKGLFDIEVSAIFIPPDRQRQDVTQTKVIELASSLQTKGQLHPIVVTEIDSITYPNHPPTCKFQLISGYRRLLATTFLRKPKITAVLYSNLTPIQAKEIELDENLFREQLSWQDEVKAKADLLELRQKLYGDSIRDVAEHMGESKSSLHGDVQLAKAMEVLPDLAKSKNKAQAASKLRLIVQRSALQVKAQQLQEDKINKTKTISNNDLSDKVFLGDCTILSKNLPNESVDCVITDPPYGINLDNNETKKASNHPTIYQDDHYQILDLVDQIASEAYRILKNDTHAYFFFDIKSHSEVLQILKKAGFLVDPIPLLWAKKTGQVNNPDSRWASCYESAFFCRKGNRPLFKQGQRNILDYDPVPTKQKIHPVEKPVGLLRQLIESSTVPGEIVVDFFGGSGSTALAALQLGRDFLTYELDSAYHMGIVERLNDYAENLTSHLDNNGDDSDLAPQDDNEDDWDQDFKLN